MQIINKILIILIKFYKFLISPFFQNSCRFEPSCSSYCIECLKNYNLFKALFFSVKRILKCNPWFGSGGFDPVNIKKKIK